MLKNISYFLQFILAKIMLFFTSFLSYERASFVGSVVAKFSYPLARYNKKLAIYGRRGIDIAFADKLTEQQREEILKGAWDNFLRTIFEYGVNDKLKFFDNKKQLIPNGDVYIDDENLKILNQLKENKGKYLLASGHFANWEIIGRFLKDYDIDVHAILRKPNNPYFEKIYWARGLEKKYILYKNQSQDNRRFLKIASSGDQLLIGAYDQHFRDGIKIKFFGHDAWCPISIVKMALKYKKDILGIRVIRNPEYLHKFIVDFRIIKIEEVSSDAKVNLQHNTELLYKFYEDWISEYPKQWLWFHNRWR